MLVLHEFSDMDIVKNVGNVLSYQLYIAYLSFLARQVSRSTMQTTMQLVLIRGLIDFNINYSSNCDDLPS